MIRGAKELRYLGKGWSDSVVLRFILVGGLDLAFQSWLSVLVAKFLGEVDSRSMSFYHL